MSSHEFWKISKNTFFNRTPPVAASRFSYQLVQRHLLPQGLLPFVLLTLYWESSPLSISIPTENNFKVLSNLGIVKEADILFVLRLTCVNVSMIFNWLYWNFSNLFRKQHCIKHRKFDLISCAENVRFHKSSHQEIRWNYSILCGIAHCLVLLYSSNMLFKMPGAHIEAALNNARVY